MCKRAIASNHSIFKILLPWTVWAAFVTWFEKAFNGRDAFSIHFDGPIFFIVYFISYHFSRFSFRRCFNVLSSKVLSLDRSFGSSQAPFSAKEIGRADNIVDLEVQNLRGQRMAAKFRKVSACHRTLFKKRSASKPCLSHVCHMQAAAPATGDFRDYSEVLMCSSSSLKKSLSDVNHQASRDKSLRIGKVRYCW